MDNIKAKSNLLESEESIIVDSFCELLNYSKELFFALRELPQFGQRQWQSHFARTFEAYTRLWKFQQENRLVLDKKYNLKRWQIGEIASKIAQLYYHYYLRTSETNYLNEAYQFYSAIRTRQYFRNVHKETDCADLLVKKYRYYARFIIVCLLLNYRSDVAALIKDLTNQVNDHKTILQEHGVTDWDDVLREIRNFPDADPVEVLDAESYQKCVLPMRLQSTTLPACDSGFKPILSLGDVIIVGNSPTQLKFSEFTIDMLRMVNVFERSPGVSGSVKRHPTEEKAAVYVKRENPHKCLLYKPDIFNLLAHVSSAVQVGVFRVMNNARDSSSALLERTRSLDTDFQSSSSAHYTFMKELRPSHTLLLYISAQGKLQKNKRSESTVQVTGYSGDGVVTNDPSKDMNNNSTKTTAISSDLHSLQPADLYPFTRKPLLLIVDSDNSLTFSKFPDLFDQPMLCLLSPTSLPDSTKASTKNGRLMTSFFYSPLMGFMLSCGIDRISDFVYKACSPIMDKIMYELQRLFLRSKSVDYNFLVFFGDDFLRLILLRFAFFACTLNMHKAFKEKLIFPVSKPNLPQDFFNSTAISKAILELADMLGTQGLFLPF